MPTLITRRRLLQTAGQATIAAVALRQLTTQAAPASFNLQATPVQTAAAAQFNPAFARIDEFIAQHMRDVGAPGLTLALANRAGLLRATSYGLADTKSGARVTPDMLFEIGSISKSFVVIALLQQRDEGKFDPHKPVVEYLPWLKIKSSYAPITGQQLIAHTSGLPDDPLLVSRNPLAEFWLGFAPGSHFSYSNTGYTLLGHILEAIDRRPFAEIIQRRVLAPLGMSASASVITNDVRARLPIGYTPFYDDRPFPRHGRLGEAAWIEVREAAGSIAATPADMGKYLRFLLTGGQGARGAVVSADSFKPFTQPVIKAPFWGDENASYGYGLWVSETDKHTLLRHTGGMVAFSSAMHADLTDGLGVFASVNANLNGYRPNAVARFALEAMRAAMHEQPQPSLPPPIPAADLVKNAADYAGTFKAMDNRQLDLVAAGDKLSLVHDGQRIALEPAGADQFIVKHPDFELFTLGFGRTEGKVIEAFHGADWYTNERYTGARTFDYPKEWAAFAGHYRNDSPWAGSTRIVLRKGKLWAEGQQELVPLADGFFRVGADYSPERISFGAVLDGRAMRMTFSATDFYRTFTP
ncbi:MAG: serine hydrolase domain-containing protein [Pyrinomonadaceae bacterium]